MEQVLILKDLLNIAALQNELPWQPFREGVDIYQLYSDDKGSAAAMLPLSTRCKGSQTRPSRV